MATLEKMRVSKFFKPYNKDGTTNLGFSKSKAGVYIIKKSDKIVYIGYSATNLYKTLTRHFQSWEDNTQVRVSYGKYQRDSITVRVIVTTPARAEKLERALILKHEPKDNPNKLKGYKLDRGEKELLKTYEQQPPEGYTTLENPF